MWYVVHPWWRSEKNPKAKRKFREASVWSISKDPNKEGWDTDNGYQSAGGLTFDEATELVEAANKGLEK